jgi:hypothetical protein
MQNRSKADVCLYSSGKSIMSFFRVVRILIVCGASVSSPLASAQTTSIGNDVARPIPGAGHDYVHLLSETVNPANGSVNIKIDLPVPKSRGISLPFAITYNSGGVNHFVSGAPGLGSIVQDNTTLTTGGWGNTLPYSGASVWTQTKAILNDSADCMFSSSYTFYDPSGGSHMLGLSGTPSRLEDILYRTPTVRIADGSASTVETAP